MGRELKNGRPDPKIIAIGLLMVGGMVKNRSLPTNRFGEREREAAAGSRRAVAQCSAESRVRVQVQLQAERRRVQCSAVQCAVQPAT